MNLIKYGPIFVSAGISITGVLWYTRGPGVHGEDLAAVTAAVTERAVAYHTGTNDYAFTSNVVQSGVSWSPLYDTVLCAARNMATNSPKSVPALFWLDTSAGIPVDGDAIATGNAEWHVALTDTESYTDTNRADRTFYSYHVAPTTNCTDGLPTTATRLPSDGINLMPGVSVTNLPLCALFYDTATAQLGADFEYDPGNWWTRIGMGTNAYKYVCEKVVSNALTVASRAVASTNLYEAKTVLTELKRSVYVCAYSALSYTNGTRWLDTALISTNTGYKEQAGTWNIDDGISEAIGDLANYSTTAATWDGKIASVYLTASWWETIDHWPYSPPDLSLELGSADIQLEYKQFTGCTLPYPSEYACASGYVASVSIYLVARVKYPTARLHGNSWLYRMTEVLTFSGDSIQPNHFDEANDGLGYTRCPITATIWPADSLTEAYDIYGYDAPEQLSAIRLSLVGTYTAPTHQPQFTLGTDTLRTPIELIHGVDFKMKDYDPMYPDTYATHEFKERSIYYQVNVTHFVVVVDWTWKHMGPEEYEPEVNTPAWTTH
jgi:hypothetical protein